MVDNGAMIANEKVVVAYSGAEAEAETIFGMTFSLSITTFVNDNKPVRIEELKGE
jgi:hypothetical protein